MMKKAILNMIVAFFFFGCHGAGTPSLPEQMHEINQQAQNVSAVEENDWDQRPFMQADITSSRQNTITRSVKNVSPAVVGINVIQVVRYRQYSPFYDDSFWGMFYRPREYQQRVKGLGSGFIISPDGYILTNAHVVHNAAEIIVTLMDGKQRPATVAGKDEEYDVALLKIEGSNYSFIRLGDSDDLIIGEWVVALGNPFGLFDISSQPTVTVGVISSTGIDFKGDNQVKDRIYTGMIQTDAAINGGNSGGPLVNSLGQCIGINTFIFSGSSQKTSVGIGFAIPINRVKRILPDLKTIGEIDRSFKTGLEVEDISRMMALMLGINPGDGVVVSNVHRNSSAETAGIRQGDIIVTMEGRRVRSTQDVQKVINGIDVMVQNEIQLQIFRQNKLVDVTLVLERK